MDFLICLDAVLLAVTAVSLPLFLIDWTHMDEPE